MKNCPRILFLFVNYAFMGGHQPVGIASLAAMLKAHGYHFDFLDTSFVLKNPSYEESQDGHIKTGLKELFNQQKNLAETIEIFLKKYNPSNYDILLASSLTTTHSPTQAFIKAIKERNPKIFTIVGGIHSTILPDETIADPNIDAICIGEGEEALIQFLDGFSNKRSYRHVRNFWFKKGSGIIKNSIRQRIDLDSLPFPDYSIFIKDHFYTPFVGKIYKTIALEISRGCPFYCSYCVNKQMQDLYGGLSKYHTQHSLDKAIAKLVYLKEKFKPEYLRFIDESFTVMSLSYLEEFAEQYRKKINIPFWVQTSAATLNEKKIQALKKMNCAALTIGAEHGNEKFRKTVLKKIVSDSQIYEAMALLKKYDIRRSAYFMIGLPFETRRLVFDTIKMYKRLIYEYDAAPSGIQCFYPFPGSELFDICVKNNFISTKSNSVNAIFKPALDMPDLSFEEILGIKRTFFAYSVLEEKLYPIVKICEEPNPYTDKVLETISNIYAK